MANDPDAGSGFTMMEIWTHSGWIARGVIMTLMLMLLAVAFVLSLIHI